MSARDNSFSESEMEDFFAGIAALAKVSPDLAELICQQVGATARGTLGDVYVFGWRINGLVFVYVGETSWDAIARYEDHLRKRDKNPNPRVRAMIEQHGDPHFFMAVLQKVTDRHQMEDHLIDVLRTIPNVVVLNQPKNGKVISGQRGFNWEEALLPENPDLQGTEG